MSPTIDRHLAIAALENAVRNRRPGRGFIFHTDRSCRYASSDFRNAVVRHGAIQSMSGPGNPYDNACAETFFRSLKVECVDAAHFATRSRAAEAIAEYLLFYNRRRIHASLDYRTPAEFERDLIRLPSASRDFRFGHTLICPEIRGRIKSSSTSGCSPGFRFRRCVSRAAKRRARSRSPRSGRWAMWTCSSPSGTRCISRSLRVSRK